MTEIVLQHPVHIDGVEITKLVLRRPTVGDLEVMDKHTSQTTKGVVLLGLLAGQSQELIRKIDAADFAEASKVIESFLG